MKYFVIMLYFNWYVNSMFMLVQLKFLKILTDSILITIFNCYSLVYAQTSSYWLKASRPCINKLSNLIQNSIHLLACAVYHNMHLVLVSIIGPYIYYVCLHP